MITSVTQLAFVAVKLGAPLLVSATIHMPLSKTPLKIDEVTPRFSQLLSEAGTSLDAPSLEATWRVFANFCNEQVECDDERLFFEVDLSSMKADSLYVHFSRTCYGREPKGHVWSYEVLCDFCFPLDPVLEEFNLTLEAEELVEGDPDSVTEKEQFFRDANANEAMWQALLQRQPTETQIYIGES